MGPEEGEYFWAGGNFNNVNAGSVAIRHVHGVDKERNTKKEILRNDFIYV